MDKVELRCINDTVKDFFESTTIKESNFKVTENIYGRDFYEMRLGPFFIICEKEYDEFSKNNTFFVTWGLNPFIEYYKPFKDFYLLEPSKERNVKLFKKLVEYIEDENNINNYFGE